MAKVYIMCGRTGAGKTTLAKKLALELGAFRFSHDEMLRLLYGETIDDFESACSRVNQLIWKQVAELLNLNASIILEGWGGRTLRDELREALTKLAVDYEFIYVDCPAEIRLQRVLSRNLDIAGEGFQIDEDSFYRMEAVAEEFADDEQCVVVRNFKNGEIPELEIFKENL